MGNAFQHPLPPPPRFSLGRLRGGAVASLCLWASALSAAPAPTPAAGPLPASVYWQAMDRFNHEEYARALELLDRAPEAGKAGEQADVWNLRGASYLHLRRYDKARAAFTRAIEKDPGLWAARFNLAEVNFRQGKYAESRRQFEDLLGRTNRFTRSDERGFLQYKLTLTQLLAGDEKPARTYLDEHRSDRSPSLMYFYLQAALEHRHGQGRQAEQWLAQADAHYTPAAAQVFAESFRSLGWYTQRSERLIAAARRRDTSSSTPAALAVVELLPGEPPAKAAAPASAPATPPVPAPAASAPRPDFRTTAPPAPFFSADNVEAAQMPPAASEAGDLPVVDNAPTNAPAPATTEDAFSEDPRAVYSRPVVLGRPTGSGGKPKPSPSAAPSASVAPAAVTPAAPANPAASPSPAASPAPGFLEKYEQAYVKFLEKSYPDARKLLDEADAVQPGQTTSTNLRGQIFKHYYEAGYTAYKGRGDYADALAQLDEADATKPNDPDALNLRGLTCSKQKDYEHAEAAFKRAITAEPQFWAARFNYAELPFNYRNYTAARSRFEELSAQTDVSRQPKEMELTQFKIFLTLLLEGKVDAAKSFMSRQSFTGSTPARYFCQAALEFYAGNADKAQAEINSANKDYQARLVDIFKESFYRIGWLNDPSNPAGTAVAAATLPPTPVTVPSPVLAEATPSATPALVVQTAPLPTAALAMPSPETTPALAVTTAETPAPSATVAAVPVPAATPAVARVDTPKPAATPAEAARSTKLSKNDNLVRLLIIGVVVINFAWNCFQVLLAIMNHKPRRIGPVTRSPLYADRPKTEQPDEVEARR